MINKNNGNPSDPWPEIAWHNAAQVPNRRMHNIYGLCQVVVPQKPGAKSHLTAAQVQVGWVRDAVLVRGCGATCLSGGLLTPVC